MGKRIGATPLSGDRCEFTVWAPLLEQVAVEIWETPSAGESRQLPLERDELGYWQIIADHVKPGARYSFHLNGELVRPDPASQYQPEDVHGRSQLVDHNAYPWGDDEWINHSLESYIGYELHVGTFTPEGTFDAVIPRLADLQELGINAIEIMPVAQFPGDRNWGYDGAYPFAVQTSYGGVDGLKRLVDACHQRGIAVILDVVYNHFGPEGNYTRDFAPYFTNRYNTPWGAAMNFDDAYSYGVRNFVLENVLYWFRDFHMDALRLDAIHAIYDFGAKHILAEMADAVTELEKTDGRSHYLIAESDLNDSRVIRPAYQGGHGVDAQWSDDFHHSIHALLTDERSGYYLDFGSVEHLAQAWQRSFVYNWRYSPFRKRWHGNDVSDRPGSQFVVCVQNHDQVGNRMLGERLSQLTSFEGLKLAAANLILAPAIPLLFMGEEYGEAAPFLYFISHTDPDLVQAVRSGRKREFAEFHLGGEPPDAASQETFDRCILNWEARHQGHHGCLRDFYRELIALRLGQPPFANFDRNALEVSYDADHRWLMVRRRRDLDEVLICMNWNREAIALPTVGFGLWEKLLDSADQRWQGAGYTLPEKFSRDLAADMPPLSVALYRRIGD